VAQLVLERAGRRARQQVQDHLGVGRRLEDGAVPFHLLAQGVGVGQVAVVGDRDRPRAVLAVIGCAFFRLEEPDVE